MSFAFDGGRGHVAFAGGEYVYSDEIHGNPRPWGQDHDFTIENPNGGANGQPYFISASNVVPSELAPGGIIVQQPRDGRLFRPGGTVSHLAYGEVAGPWMVGGDQVTTCLNSCGTADLAPAEDRKEYLRPFQLLPE